MYKLFHCLSVTGSFMVLYGLFYLMLRYTIGLAPIIKNTKVYGIPLELPLFSVIVVAFILRYVEFGSPWLEK